MRNRDVPAIVSKQLSDKRTALASELLEAIWVAAKMRSRGANTPAVIVLDEIKE